MGSLEITMTYKDKDNKVSDNAGVVAFIDSDRNVFTIPVAVPDEDDDGPFEVTLPKGKYTVYAYTFLPEKKAYLGTIEVGADDKLEIELVDAIGVSGDVRYTAATTTRLAYIPVVITTKVNVDDDTTEEYTLVTGTDSLGSYYVLVPKGNSYFANTETLFGNFLRAASDVNIATASDTGDRTSRNISVNVNSSSTAETGINVAAQTSPSFTVNGIVLDVNGEPLKDDKDAANRPVVEYTLTVGSDTVTRKTTVATAGTFSISRVPSGAVLTITKIEFDGYVPHITLPAAYTITRNISSSERIELILDKSGDDTPYFISGIARDLTGAARADVVIEYKVDEGGLGSTIRTETVTTGTGGSFRIEGLAAADKVEFTGIAGTVYTIYGASILNPYTVAKTITNVELLLDSGTSLYAYGTVTDGTKGLVGATVNYEINGTAYTVTSLANGVFKTRAITSGANLKITGITYEGFVLDTITPSDTFNNVTASVTGVEIKAKADPAYTKVIIIPFMDKAATPAKIPYMDVDIIIGKGETADGMTTVTIDVRNNTNAAVLVVLTSSNVGFRYGASNEYVKDFVLSIPASSNRAISAQYKSGETPAVNIQGISNLAPVKITGFSYPGHDLVVKQSTTEKKPIDKSVPDVFELAPGEYNVIVRPELSDGVNDGYFYSGKLTLYAGVFTLDITDLAEEVTIVTFVLTDKDDKVTMSVPGAVEAEKAKDAPDVDRVYYIPTVDLMDCTITIESKEDIAYIDLSSVADLTEQINLEAYFGKKISVSGYVGRVADGEMTITMTAGTLTGTCVVPISNGEFTADLPKDMNGEEIEYTFYAVVTDYVNGLGREFATERSDVKDLKDKSVVNMEVEIDPTLDPPVVNGSITVSGRVRDDVGDTLWGTEITYKIGAAGKERTIETDAFGRYSISTPITMPQDMIIITSVTRTGYTDVDLSVHPLAPLEFDTDASDVDFDIVPTVIIDQTSFVPNASGTRMVEVTVTMTVTNNHGSTIVLFAGKGWSLPSFGSVNYAVIQDGASDIVTLTAFYDSERLGAGSEDLSVVVKDLMGNVLQTKTLDSSEIGQELPDEELLEVTTEGNRVSKNEYGFAVTFTALTDVSVELTELSIVDAGSAVWTSPEWFISVVDSNNVIVDTFPVIVPGNSSVTYYLRMILVNDWEDSEFEMPSETLYMKYGASADDVMKLSMDTTDLRVDDLTAGGNNIFTSLNGVPIIIWALIAFCVLMALLIFWLGMRRGVFLRKR
jgi:hypothetical protein